MEVLSNVNDPEIERGKWKSECQSTAPRSLKFTGLKAPISTSTCDLSVTTLLIENSRILNAVTENI